MPEPVRLFRCENCDHKVRFGVSLCSICGAATPTLNRRALWYSVALGLALLAFAAV